MFTRTKKLKEQSGAESVQKESASKMLRRAFRDGKATVQCQIPGCTATVEFNPFKPKQSVTCANGHIIKIARNAKEAREIAAGH